MKASHYNQTAFAQNVMAKGFLMPCVVKAFSKYLALINLINAQNQQPTKWTAFHVAKCIILNNTEITKKD